MGGGLEKVESVRLLLPRCARVCEDPGPGGVQRARGSISGCTAHFPCESDGSFTSKPGLPFREYSFAPGLDLTSSTNSGVTNLSSVSMGCQFACDFGLNGRENIREGEAERLRFKFLLAVGGTAGTPIVRSMVPFLMLNL